MDDTPGPDPVQSISAVTLNSADMGRSDAFYSALGFTRLYGGPEASFTSFSVGSGYLNLASDRSRTPGPVWGRVIFWVDDVDAMHRRCVDAGFEPASEPADAPWGERYFHILDPSGHELSFARPLGR